MQCVQHTMRLMERANFQETTCTCIVLIQCMYTSELGVRWHGDDASFHSLVGVVAIWLVLESLAWKRTEKGRQQETLVNRWLSKTIDLLGCKKWAWLCMQPRLRTWACTREKNGHFDLKHRYWDSNGLSSSVIIIKSWTPAPLANTHPPFSEGKFLEGPD